MTPLSRHCAIVLAGPSYWWDEKAAIGGRQGKQKTEWKGHRKQCAYCGKDFVTKVKSRVCCSVSCGSKHGNRTLRERQAAGVVPWGGQKPNARV